MRKGTVFFIECMDNLHMGATGDNYEHIDNLIQRDKATGFPCMNDSGVKGGIREYTFHKWIANTFNRLKIEESAIDLLDNNNELVQQINKWLRIFGAESDKKKNNINAYLFNRPDNKKYLEKHNKQPGFIERFLDNCYNQYPSGSVDFNFGLLLFTPIRSAAGVPYVMATGNTCLKDYLKRVNQFSLKVDSAINTSLKALKKADKNKGHNLKDATLLELQHLHIKPEDKSIDLSKILDKEDAFVNLKNSYLNELLSDDLLANNARNNVVMGESVNLWFEQFVPRKSIFFTSIVGEEEDTDYKDLLKAIVEAPYIHFGADETVGKGKCRVFKSN